MYHTTRWLMLLGLLTPNAMQSDPHTTLHLVVYPPAYTRNSHTPAKLPGCVPPFKV